MFACGSGPGKFLLMEVGIVLGFGIRNPAQGIRNPDFTDKYWNPIPVIPNPQHGIQNPRLSWIPLHSLGDKGVSGSLWYERLVLL